MQAHSKQHDGEHGRLERRLLVATADDLGATVGVNLAVRDAWQAGLLSSACIMPTGPAFDHALDHVVSACDGLGVGVHLTAEVGRPCLSPGDVPDLMNRFGRLGVGFGGVLARVRSNSFRDQLRREFAAQIERVMDAGVCVDHLNGHRHIHMIPAVFAIVCELACVYRIPCVRMVREPLHLCRSIGALCQPIASGGWIKHMLLNTFGRINRAYIVRAGLTTTDQCVGILHTGAMHGDAIRAGLNACTGRSAELIVHIAAEPAGASEAAALGHSFVRFLNQRNRMRELQAIADANLVAWTKANHWHTATFADLARQQASYAAKASTLPIHASAIAAP